MAEDKQEQSPLDIKTNVPQKGLVTDLLENATPSEVWTYARNVTLNSQIGQAGFMQNEQSTTLCAEAPYPTIGYIRLLNDRWAIFSTNEVNSEIGIFNANACTYTTVVNSTCLNFSKFNPIKGTSKELFNCHEAIYWSDGSRNPRRFMDLSEVPYTFTLNDDACETREYTNILDCDELLIDKHFTIPVITPTFNSGGLLLNGAYEFAIAYTSNNERITDYYSCTLPQTIWSHQNVGQSISLDIADLDPQFLQYELVVVYEQNLVTRYKSLGFFDIGVTKQNISQVDRPEFIEYTLADIIIKRPKYPYADGMTSNDQYALWYGVTTTPELNYQLQAMQIVPNYVVYQVPSNYYALGGSLVGYCRDEVYSFGIQWLLPTGDWSSVFHIPGPKLTTKDTALASGPNVYEVDVNPNAKITVENYQVFNNAGPVLINLDPTDFPQILGNGTMSPWQSSDVYPDNKIQFGPDACTPIRHHRFPDNTTTHIYANTGQTLNLLGAQFSNIEHPKDQNGNYIANITAYRIVRGDRKGNKSIIAKGLVSNVRSYTETNGTTVMYPNYPYNDLGTDTFLSSTQTANKTGETGYAGLTAYHSDQFNFYSPHTLFNTIGLGTEMAFYTEELGSVNGFFENVYKHPRAKLLTQFDLYFALIIGALDGYYAAAGKRGQVKTHVNNAAITVSLGALSGFITESDSVPITSLPGTAGIFNSQTTQAVNDALNFVSANTAGGEGITGAVENFAETVIRALAEVGVFVYFALQTAQKVLDIIAEASPYQHYALQYDSHAVFNAYSIIPIDNRRRYLSYYQYLYDGLNTIPNLSTNIDTIFNNYKRENSVYLQIQKVVDDPTTPDNTRQTVTDLGICDNLTKPVSTTASMYYVGAKRKFPNQYGTVDGINYLDTGFLDTTLTNVAAIGSKEKHYKTGVVFGGDTFINRMTVRRSHHFFSEYLYNVADGFQYDYRQFRNVAYPRYWMDSTRFDMSSVVTSSPTQSGTPKAKHNLNCTGSFSLSAVTAVKDEYFYLFNSGVLDFFCESDYNLDYRDWTTDFPTFYSKYNGDLHLIFRTDRIELREEFKYDLSFSKQLTENYLVQQRIDYDPTTDETCYEYRKNRVIYSLPAFLDQKGDNWLVYLNNNYYDFPMTEFGGLTAIHPIDNQQLIFLFDKASPYVSIGRDELQLDGSGKSITLGDAGLFVRPPRPINYSDYYYGNCQSRWAFLNTSQGAYYPAQRQGKLFKYWPLMYRQPLNEITAGLMEYWFKQYLPSNIAQQFPNYLHLDNPAIGCGVITGFDSSSNTYYITKRDYRLLDAYASLVTYDVSTDKFLLDGNPGPQLGDPNYFEDASWTVSYSTRGSFFISWHDWHPNWILQSENHFITISNLGFWKHNEGCGSYCTYYGVQYPFEVEYVVNNGQNVEVLKSIEYQMDIGLYFSDCRNFHTVLDDNFDYLIVYNTEQCSGLLHLNLQAKNDMSQLLGYPRYNINLGAMDILYAKEEQKHRINMFSDMINDRGEFTKNNFPIWLTDANGYTRTMPAATINISKPVQLQKKFRATWHKIFFSKTTSGNRKYVFKFLNSKENYSFR